MVMWKLGHWFGAITTLSQSHADHVVPKTAKCACERTYNNQSPNISAGKKELDTNGTLATLDVRGWRGLLVHAHDDTAILDKDVYTYKTLKL